MSSLQLFGPGSNPFFRDVDRFFNHVSQEAVDRSFRPETTVKEYEDRFELSLDVPGVPKSAIDIEVGPGVVKISGERSKISGSDDGKVRLEEQRFGSFTRSFKVPEDVDSEKIEATYESGVLNLILPKTEKVTPRKLTIA